MCVCEYARRVEFVRVCDSRAHSDLRENWRMRVIRAVLNSCVRVNMRAVLYSCVCVVRAHSVNWRVRVIRARPRIRICV